MGDSLLFSSGSRRPVYTLFDLLLKLGARPDESSGVANEGLFEKSDRETLNGIATSASTLQRTIHLGTAAIGRYMALAAPEVADNDQFGAGTIEAIGWLLAEMADLSALCHHFETTASRFGQQMEEQGNVRRKRKSQ